MANQPCPIAVPCLGDNGLGNFSSEAPDRIEFGALGFPIYTPSDPIGEGPTTGPVPPWYTLGCLGFCLSTVSQFAADLCAVADEFACKEAKNKTQVFFNGVAQCSFTCPDGSLFTWIIGPGVVEATSQVMADRLANQYACQQANKFFFCLPSISPACLGEFYSQSITLTHGQSPFTFAIVLGALPPGLSFAQTSPITSTISGTPTMDGSFQFTIQATDSGGNTTQKAYTLNVLGITNLASAPAPQVGQAYSFQLLAAGGTAPFTFTVTGGALPDGLTMSASGLISGTPTTAQTSAFTIQIEDSAP